MDAFELNCKSCDYSSLHALWHSTVNQRCKKTYRQWGVKMGKFNAVLIPKPCVRNRHAESGRGFSE